MIVETELRIERITSSRMKNGCPSRLPSRSCHQPRSAFRCLSEPMICQLKSPNLLIRASDNGNVRIEAICIWLSNRDRPSFLHGTMWLGEMAIRAFHDCLIQLRLVRDEDNALVKPVEAREYFANRPLK